MALRETEDTFPIEFLPIELIETLAAYLTTKELAACCAVSHRMREIFGDNILWRKHCDPDIAVYLKITTCKVEPAFVSPEPEDSSLSPISEWRLAYMRENHLWNNWRQGKSKTEEIKNQHSADVNYYTLYDMFYTNDIVLSLHRDRVELLDVREYPVEESTNPIYYPFSNQDQLQCINDLILIVYNTRVQVYKVNLSVKMCTMEHEFFFDESKKRVISGRSDISTRKCVYTVTGKFFVGMIKGESILHIWDLEIGEKVKEELFPLFRNGEVIEIKASTTMNLVMSFKVISGDCIILAYSLNTLSFLMFKETYKTIVQYFVCEDFVGIYSNNRLDVYNYRTTELLLKDELIQSEPRFHNGNFVFMQNQTVKLFNTRTRVLKFTPLQGFNKFEIMSNKFIQLQGNWSRENEIWEIRGNFEGVKKTSMSLKFNACTFFLNSARTRYIVRYGGFGSIIHFW